MKSILGASLATALALAFLVAWWLATRDGASLLDQQWLFLVALPYNFSVVGLFGDSDFSPDAPRLVLAAALTESAVAYLAGAALGAALAALGRGVRRFRPRA